MKPNRSRKRDAWPVPEEGGGDERAGAVALHFIFVQASSGLLIFQRFFQRSGHNPLRYRPYKAVDAVANSNTFKSARELLAKVYTASVQGASLP